jgi:AraC family cel operon transcriptional repressor
LDQLRRLQTLFDELGSGPWNIFATERFLLNLFHVIPPATQVVSAERTSRPPMPDWLVIGLARWRGEVKHFGGGTATLAQLAGRSPEHVARTLRECTGRTPTDCLNEMRMRYAAQQLAVTNRKILDIAMECGFDSLGHFYSLFHEAQGCPPRAYRMRFQPRPI